MREQRKFIRLRAPIGIVYRRVKKQRRLRAVPSLVRNISGGGLSFLSKEGDLKHGDLLKLEIQIPHLEEPIRAVGEVVWFAPVHEDKESASREVGVRFRDIESQSLHHILEYVHTIGIG